MKQSPSFSERWIVEVYSKSVASQPQLEIKLAKSRTTPVGLKYYLEFELDGVVNDKARKAPSVNLVYAHVR